MGFEYKIIISLATEQVHSIYQYFEDHTDFKRTKDQFGNECLEFKSSENTGRMPNTYVVLEPDGICICQNSSSYLWKNIEGLRHYLATNMLDYTIMDYQS